MPTGPQPAIAIAIALARLEARATVPHLEFAPCDELTTLRRVYACLRPGNEIWTLANPPVTWKAGAGRTGFAIVRAVEILDGVLRCAE